MKNNKVYQFENVQYCFSRIARKWQFTAGSYTVYHVVNGREVADKIARIINGAFKRTKQTGIDNLARVNINQVLTKLALD